MVGNSLRAPYKETLGIEGFVFRIFGDWYLGLSRSKEGPKLRGTSLAPLNSDLPKPLKQGICPNS